MLSRIWLINAILALLVVFFGLKAHGVWIQGNKGGEIPEIAQKKPTRGVTKPSKELYDIKIPPESKFDVLMSRNLFSLERTEIISETEKQDEKSKKLSTAEQKNIKQYFSNLILYGLVITNDSAEALVSYPGLKSALKSRKIAIPENRRRNIQRMTAKQTKWVKAGDTLGNFKVLSIKPDRVLLKVGDQSYDLLLYDKEKFKKRGPAKPKTGPNVVGVSVKPKAGPKVAKVPAKSPVVNVRRQSTTPLPTKKKVSGAAVTKRGKVKK